MSDKKYYVNQTSASHAVGDAMDLRHPRPAIRADRYLVESGTPALLHLAGFVDRVGLEGEAEKTVAPADLEVFDPEGSRPGIVLHPGCERSRYRLFRGPGHWMVAVRMKLDSLDDCCSR